METSEANTHPFIVKIWLEESRRATWRGQITHVPSGKRRAFSDLSDMTAFIVLYLESMGVTPGFWQRVKQRLVRLRNGRMGFVYTKRGSIRLFDGKDKRD